MHSILFELTQKSLRTNVWVGSYLSWIQIYSRKNRIIAEKGQQGKRSIEAVEAMFHAMFAHNPTVLWMMKSRRDYHKHQQNDKQLNLHEPHTKFLLSTITLENMRQFIKSSLSSTVGCNFVKFSSDFQSTNTDAAGAVDLISRNMIEVKYNSTKENSNYQMIRSFEIAKLFRSELWASDRKIVLRWWKISFPTLHILSESFSFLDSLEKQCKSFFTSRGAETKAKPFVTIHAWQSKNLKRRRRKVFLCFCQKTKIS